MSNKTSTQGWVLDISRTKEMSTFDISRLALYASAGIAVIDRVLRGEKPEDIDVRLAKQAIILTRYIPFPKELVDFFSSIATQQGQLKAHAEWQNMLRETGRTLMKIADEQTNMINMLLGIRQL